MSTLAARWTTPKLGLKVPLNVEGLVDPRLEALKVFERLPTGRVGVLIGTFGTPVPEHAANADSTQHHKLDAMQVTPTHRLSHQMPSEDNPCLHHSLRRGETGSPAKRQSMRL
jgi:hypothetical protein